jgi:hypothetical protein
VAHRTRTIVLIVLAAFLLLLLLFLLGYVLFNVGGTVPGTGEGDVLTTP